MGPPEFTAIHLHHDDATSIATLSLNRPAQLNALSRVLLTELIEACAWIDGRHDLKVVIVRGEGRAFSAGFDLGDFTDQVGGGSPRETADLGRLATEALDNIRPLTIASIHGYCIGGGVVLAAACDLRLASDSARFSIPEVDLGIPLAWGGIPRLTREFGPAITKELVLTCREFDADEAHRLRFINRVLPTDELEVATLLLARELAAKPGYALRTTKQQVDAVTEEIAGTARNAADADALVVAMGDPESRAAARRYLEQRAR